jgi:DNA (cytosine-5)-methyltransferase 1
LFHQGIRIIKELRELSNGKYPTWSIWENVAGALSSNNGADFGEVLYEMDEAGACFSEWSMLDAQYFGVPQRRRRVFVISCFDSAIAARCPDQILTVGESRGGDSTKGKPSRQGATDTAAESFGTGSELGSGEPVANCISASLCHHGTVVNQDANNGHVVVENPIFFSHTQGLDAQPSEIKSPTLRTQGSGMAVAVPKEASNIVGSLQARDWKGVGNQYVMENKLVVQQTPS